MKFAKGMIIGGILATGALMMCKEDCLLNKNNKNIMKKGKKIMKKIGII